ncbi:MAG: asparagine synthase, partial [Clostridia bacterium]|nr:asparagine synthase [Clostridia bacterium]
MLDAIAHRGPAGRKVLRTKAATLGVVWPEAQDEDYSRMRKRSLVWDGRFSGNLDWVEKDSPLALAYVDRRGLHLLRDGLGVAPLYYGEIDGVLAFASEIKALVGQAERIKEFPPGHWYHPKKGLVKFFDLQPVPPLTIEAEEAATRLRACLKKSIKGYAETGEVGSLLSGGLDSSTMAALARPYLEELHTFAVGLKGAPDLHYARQIAGHIRSEHHEATASFDELLKVLPEVIYHLESFDAPLIRSSLTHYLVTKMAAEYVPAVFSGEGSDELFAGYSYIKKLPPEKLPEELIDITRRLHNTALQRVDGMTAANGLVAYMSFLDPEVVSLALRIPPEYKLYRGDGQPVEKWILRKAMEGILPEEVLYRPKVKFWEGAGVADKLARYADEKISDFEFRRERTLPDGSKLRSKEELLYYRIFCEHFGELPDLSFIGRTKTPLQTA